MQFTRETWEMWTKEKEELAEALDNYVLVSQYENRMHRAAVTERLSRLVKIRIAANRRFIAERWPE